MSYSRELDNKTDILETISETDYKEISIEYATEVIRRASQHWWVLYKQLLPLVANVHSIWDDGLDIYLVLEGSDDYIAWNWSSSA